MRPRQTHIGGYQVAGAVADHITRHQLAHRELAFHRRLVRVRAAAPAKSRGQKCPRRAGTVFAPLAGTALLRVDPGQPLGDESEPRPRCLR
ncbi:hypothetical protein [Streptomyces cucumeris]|uniref:hypothetical protein n=1 Tax=Streptomyces cucumeris TaxID=2962890 RepID=UPI003D75CD0A